MIIMTICDKVKRHDDDDRWEQQWKSTFIAKWKWKDFHVFTWLTQWAVHRQWAHNNSLTNYAIIRPLPLHHLFNYHPQVGECQRAPITTYFALEMITAVEVVEWGEGHKITFTMANGLPAQNRSEFDYVAASLPRCCTGRGGDRGKKKKRKKCQNESRSRLRDEKETSCQCVQWCGAGVVLTDEQLWLARADAEHTYIGRTRTWGWLMIHERELPLLLHRGQSLCLSHE